MQREFFTFDGMRLSYLEAGTQNARKLLIAHANGYAAGCYEYLISALSDRYHVCALDFAGHGESESTLNFADWNFFSRQLLALGDHLRWQSFSAIGHSLGGGSLLRAAEADCRRFEQLVVFDPVMLSFLMILYVKLFGNPMAKVARTRRGVFSSKEQALKIFSRHPANRSWEREAVAAYVEYCIRQTEQGAELCCAPAVEAQIFSQTEFAHLFRLGRIGCETHIVLPPKSNVCANWVARKIVRQNSQSALHRIADSGHLLPFENRRLTLDLVNSLL
ncbi:MAG: alpha/beta hydrolase [Turneriella sp.]